MLLLGEENSKRTAFFGRAAQNMHTEIQMMDWKGLLSGSSSFHTDFMGEQAVKLDPPSYQTVCLQDMEKELVKYQMALQRLSRVDAFFLNAPEAVAMLLDKRVAKERLQEGNIPATQQFPIQVRQPEELFGWMKGERITSVFVKPRFFSGAAGVMAVRRHPGNGRLRAYTSCCLQEGHLINTKRLFAIQREEELLPVLQKILELDCVVERWHPKSSVSGGKSYDLRVVYQFGHISHIVVRRSDGPITNLHLNNRAMEIERLGLSDETVYQIEELCALAVRQFQGLQMAGIDILLEKGTGRPLIIEMNGQGDLIYQDIYGENRIYTEQIMWMKQVEEAGKRDGTD